MMNIISPNLRSVQTSNLVFRNKCIVGILVLGSFCFHCNAASSCDEKRVSTAYLETAIDMISKAKNNMLSPKQKALDCLDVLHEGHNRSGVYKLWPVNRLTEDKSIDVYCDMETSGGGWTVFQRRGNFGRSKDFFYKGWKSYKEGFGDIEKDFWLGNDNIFALTNQKLYSLRFDLQDVGNNKRYAQYDKFWIDDENNKYTMHVSDFSGDAGDSFTDHDNGKFSARDQDNDSAPNENCADRYKGGWWYKQCHVSNLNGLYHNGTHESFADGVNWKAWKDYHESLKHTEIKIRPKNFRDPNARPKASDEFVITPM